MAKGRPRPPRLELSSCRELNCKSSTTTYARTCRPSSAKRTYMRPVKLSVYLEEYIYCLPPIYKLPCATNEFGLHQDLVTRSLIERVEEQHRPEQRIIW